MKLSNILFSYEGRIGRTPFLLATVFIWTFYFNILFFSEQYLGDIVLVLLLPFFWSLFAISAKRLHDFGKSSKHFLLLLIPVAGPIYVFIEMLVRKGVHGSNNFGDAPGRENPDYIVVASPGINIINDVTQLNPITVKRIYTPATTKEIAEIIQTTSGPVSIGGGRFSMGGQVSSPDSIHLDLRGFNKIISFNAIAKTIRVQTGVRWCDIQRTIDNQNLSVKIMQTYANFTVGGSLSVNSHGRYMGLGPLVLSVRSIVIVLAHGEIKEASRDVNADIFYGAIGGYGALGVITEAELDLTDNVRVERNEIKLNRKEYAEYFAKNIRNNINAVFHNADIYPPQYKRLRAVTWTKTDAPVTAPWRLMPLQRSYPIHRYFYWAFSETLTGKWRREFIIEPLLYRTKKVHWRNYEAGYDVAELEPSSRKKTTYVLQEYFVPVKSFDDFTERMSVILKKYNVNMINISVRHALVDPGTLLAWARTEVFAFVLYYKQGTSEDARKYVGEWTRALIDAVLLCDGAYYLPYQPHATQEQFHKAYPGATKLFELKHRLDPEFRFRNVLWNKYYAPTLNPELL